MGDKGIIKGYSEESFAPDDLCTREQFMTFLYRAAGEPEVGAKATFSDVAEDAYYADAVAWAYYVKGARTQYDSIHFSRRSGYHGGMCRIAARTAREYATDDYTFYTVCSDYTSQVYYEALNMNAIADVTYPFGLSTSGVLRYSENQRQTVDCEEILNEPLDEKDADAALMTWIDYDRHTTSKRNELYINNALEFSSYYDLCLRTDSGAAACSL